MTRVIVQPQPRTTVRVSAKRITVRVSTKPTRITVKKVGIPGRDGTAGEAVTADLVLLYQVAKL